MSDTEAFGHTPGDDHGGVERAAAEPERAEGQAAGEAARPSGIALARQALAQAQAAARERGASSENTRRRLPRRPRRASGQPERFGTAIRAWLIERGWQEHVAIGGVFGRWEEIVGRQLAEHVKPVSLESGELVVAADSATWATQLRALTPQLMRKLNEELGDGSVRSISVRGPGSAPRGAGRRRVRERRR